MKDKNMTKALHQSDVKQNTMIPMANPEGPAIVKRDIKAELAALKEKHRKPVRGIFKFYESPGGTLSFSFRQYEANPETYSFVHDQVYTIPLGVAIHLNKNGWYPLYAYGQDAEFRSTVKVGKKIRRFGFQSLEFSEDPDLMEDPGLITVEHA